ncbi:MAG: transporter [Deltaproteobacteria bacterium]|nr:transporter [Deltaproteobacteria bacterium]
MHLKKTIIIGIIALLVTPFLCYGAETDWEIGLEPSFTSGDYGTGTDTDITYIPLTISRSFPDGDLSLTIPYIQIESSGGVTVVGGTPNRITKGGGGTRFTSSRRSTEEGLGDVLLQGRYYVLEEGDLAPLMAVTGLVKFPTADEDKGLGTGELDLGFGLEFSKTFSRNWLGLFDVGYTFIGEPSGFDLRDQWYYDVGLGYYLTGDILISGYYEEWRSLVSDESNPRDLFFTMNYRFSSEIEFTAGMLFGLSDGAPDYGLSGGVRLRF